MKTMNLEKITATMDKFEQSFDKLDLTTSTMEGAMGSAMATSAPTSSVDALIRQVCQYLSKFNFNWFIRWPMKTNWMLPICSMLHRNKTPGTGLDNFYILLPFILVSPQLKNKKKTNSKVDWPHFVISLCSSLPNSKNISSLQ